MRQLRRYGRPPFDVVLLHGGPGAAGEMASVAERLGPRFGVVEPMQTEPSVDGQIEELRELLEAHASTPARLVGYSWGAWLAWLLASRHPDLVSRLVLVGAGPFEARYVAAMAETRASRWSGADKAELARLESAMADADAAGRAALFARVGALYEKSDGFDPDPSGHPPVEVSATIHAGVWPEAAELRRSGRLLAAGRTIACPVVAIHGDHDPHPAAGVRDPLTRTLKDFTFIGLARCGHTPWIERQARETFFAALESQLRV